MKEIYIYGAGHYGLILKNLIDEYYREEIHIVAFIDKNKIGMYEGVNITNIEAVSQNADIIIALNYTKVAVEVYKYLSSMGYMKLWRFYEERTVNRSFFEDQCIDCCNWSKGVLAQVEMHIMDACNLNCRGCSHFSPIFEKKYPAFESRIRDVQKLSERIGYLERFYILGGEPFLNSEIGDYAIEIARIFPNTKIWIVTNGLLIPNLDEAVLNKIKKSGASISISEYIPTQKIIDKIVEKISEYGIAYEIRAIDKKMKFNKPLSLSGKTSKEKLCISDGCVTIWNGMISRCPTLMYIEYFNEYFDTALPSIGRYSLYDDKSENIKGWELVEKMSEPVPLCKHCVKNEIEWSSCGKHPQLSDFACEN